MTKKRPFRQFCNVGLAQSVTTPGTRRYFSDHKLTQTVTMCFRLSDSKTMTFSASASAHLVEVYFVMFFFSITNFMGIQKLDLTSY